MVSTGRAYKSSLDAFTASLLAVLLFCGTALAGVCPLRCELRRGVAAAQQVAEDVGMAMPVGHCHGMTGAAAKDTVSVRCAAVPCGYAEVSAAVADEGVRALLVVAQPMVVVEMVVVRPLQRVAAGWNEAEGPPRAGVGFDPLIGALRV